MGKIERIIIVITIICFALIYGSLLTNNGWIVMSAMLLAATNLIWISYYLRKKNGYSRRALVKRKKK